MLYIVSMVAGHFSCLSRNFIETLFRKNLSWNFCWQTYESWDQTPLSGGSTWMRWLKTLMSSPSFLISELNPSLSQHCLCLGETLITTSKDDRSFSFFKLCIELTLQKIAIWLSINCQKLDIFSKKLPKIFILKKCQVFGYFLTVKWLFSGGSAVDMYITALVSLLLKLSLLF